MITPSLLIFLLVNLFASLEDFSGSEITETSYQTGRVRDEKSKIGNPEKMIFYESISHVGSFDIQRRDVESDNSGVAGSAGFVVPVSVAGVIIFLPLVFLAMSIFLIFFWLLITLILAVLVGFWVQILVLLVYLDILVFYPLWSMTGKTDALRKSSVRGNKNKMKCFFLYFQCVILFSEGVSFLITTVFLIGNIISFIILAVDYLMFSFFIVIFFNSSILFFCIWILAIINPCIFGIPYLISHFLFLVTFVVIIASLIMFVLLMIFLFVFGTVSALLVIASATIHGLHFLVRCIPFFLAFLPSVILSSKLEEGLLEPEYKDYFRKFCIWQGIFFVMFGILFIVTWVISIPFCFVLSIPAIIYLIFVIVVVVPLGVIMYVLFANSMFGMIFSFLPWFFPLITTIQSGVGISVFFMEKVTGILDNWSSWEPDDQSTTDDDDEKQPPNPPALPPDPPSASSTDDESEEEEDNLSNLEDFRDFSINNENENQSPVFESEDEEIMPDDENVLKDLERKKVGEFANPSAPEFSTDRVDGYNLGQVDGFNPNTTDSFNPMFVPSAPTENFSSAPHFFQSGLTKDTPLSSSLKNLGTERIKEDLRALEELKDEKLCVVCCDMNRSMLITPCNHLCLCEECSKKIGDTCPICRGGIAAIVKVFT